MAEVVARKRGLRKERRGVVLSRSGDKSIVVMVDSRKQHPLYGKVVKRFKKFHAHDEENAAKVGDLVRIRECRPLSRTKRWRVVGILESREQG